MPEDSDHYSGGDSWAKVVEGVQDCAPVADRTPGISWYVFADVGELCGERHELGAGGDGVAIVPRHDLEVLADSTRIKGCERTHRRSRQSVAGGFIHEFAHTLGLPHPPGCEDGRAHCDHDALMDLGVFEYPDTYLRPDEKEFLMRSRFIGRTGPRGASPPREFAVQGVVRDASGAPLRGVRVSIVSDSYWNWEETGFTGAFSIDVPDKKSGPFLVSVHAGDTAADCNWLGYHGPGGLHALRREATLVNVADGDPESIEVTLPLAPDALCNLDRTLSGVLVGPGDRPVEGVLVWFERFGVRTDQDGSWEHPSLFEGWWIDRLHRPLSITLPQCDKEIFFTQDGFTEAVNWAFELERRFEVAPLGITDLRMRLRASPEQLCREG